MKKLQFALGIGMLIALITGSLAFVSGSTALSGFPVPYLASNAQSPLAMDWAGLFVNIAAWSVVAYVIIFAVERFGGKK